MSTVLIFFHPHAAVALRQDENAADTVSGSDKKSKNIAGL